METVITIATIVAAFVLWGLGVKLIREYVETFTIWDFQSGLHFRHGKFIEILEAGKHRLFGKGHTVILHDHRICELVVQGQELITADSATVKLTAVAQWKIVDPQKFYTGAEDARQALYTIIQLALRQLVGGLALDAVMEKKASFAGEILDQVRGAAALELGVEVLRVDIRDLMLGGELKSAYSAVITARQEARAKQERARGEAAALRTMANAARAFENNPELFRLRYLETLKEAGAGYGNQLIIGVPEEMMALVKKE